MHEDIVEDADLFVVQSVRFIQKKRRDTPKNFGSTLWRAGSDCSFQFGNH